MTKRNAHGFVFVGHQVNGLSDHVGSKVTRRQLDGIASHTECGSKDFIFGYLYFVLIEVLAAPLAIVVFDIAALFTSRLDSFAIDIFVSYSLDSKRFYRSFVLFFIEYLMADRTFVMRRYAALFASRRRRDQCSVIVTRLRDEIHPYVRRIYRHHF